MDIASSEPNLLHCLLPLLEPLDLFVNEAASIIVSVKQSTLELVYWHLLFVTWLANSEV